MMAVEKLFVKEGIKESEVEKYLSKILGGDLPSHPQLADLIVLAINTTKVTTRKEYGSRTMPSNEHRFLTKMRTIGRDESKSPHPTFTNFTL